MLCAAVAVAALLAGPAAAQGQAPAPAATAPPRQGPPPPPPPPAGWPIAGQPIEYLPKSAQGQHQTPAWPTQTRAPYAPSQVKFQLKTVAEGLEDPWGLAFLPDGRMLVTERPGRMRIVNKDGSLSPATEGTPKVHVQQISGMQDVVLDPHFAQNHRVYWTYVELRPKDGVEPLPASAPGRLTPDQIPSGVTLASGRLVDGPNPSLEDVKVIYRQLPTLITTHSNYGGRFIFGKDGYIYLALGDRDELNWRPLIQKLDNGIGKIVRIKTDGTAAPGGPFAKTPGALPELWAYGFRNTLGITWRGSTGQLWVVDVGPRGGDFLAKIEPGKDYGWPLTRYGQEYSGEEVGKGPHLAGMEEPNYYWDPVISPSSVMFYDGKLFPAWKGSAFVTSLTQQHLVRLDLKGDKVVGEERLLADQHERLREVIEGPDGAIYILTDNAKGRILKLVP
jgi:glucose/arabinose dehydrogenase